MAKLTKVDYGVSKASYIRGVKDAIHRIKMEHYCGDRCTDTCLDLRDEVASLTQLIRDVESEGG